MAINLTKGQTINLDKEKNDLNQITIGLGWKVRKKPGGFLSSLFGSSEPEFDLDAICFLLDDKGKITTPGNKQLQGGDIIFFNNRQHFSGCVIHSGDNRTGGAGVQDDEQIIVTLGKLPQQYSRIVFLVSIYQGIQKNQTFGSIEKAFIRAIDGKGQEMARYSLAEDGEYAQMRTVVFGEVYRKDGSWKFRAMGEGYPTDTFINVLSQYW